MLAVLAVARRQSMTLSAAAKPALTRHLCERLQNYPNAKLGAPAQFQDDTREDVLSHVSAMLEELEGCPTAFDTTDGHRYRRGRGDIIHLPPNSNATKLRCYAEHSTPKREASLNHKVLEIIRTR